MSDQLDRITALQIIESLRKGIPPEKGIQAYSVGNEKLIKSITRQAYFEYLSDMGLIRFVSGSWGSGKTHLFRLLKDMAFEKNCLVSNVQLSNNDACLNKFERVLSAIISNITTSRYNNGDKNISSFGLFLRESFAYLSKGDHSDHHSFSSENYAKAEQILMANENIDIDFKKIIKKYWSTFLPESSEPFQTRGELLQWFSGEGTLAFFRQRFGVNKIVTKQNCQFLFQSLAKLIHLSGYQGLVILFDEAELSYSTMRQSDLRVSHTNLMSLINNIDQLKGLFLLYATTSDFYTDPQHGIRIFPALHGRIGEPEEHPPKAFDRVWNLDAVSITLEDYSLVAIKISRIFKLAYPEDQEVIPRDKEIKEIVENLFNQHPKFSGVRFWRILVTALVKEFDQCLDEGVTTKIENYGVYYKNVVESLREI